MNRFTVLLSLLISCLFIVIGCSGGGGGAPIAPTGDQESAQDLTAASGPDEQQSQARLWGYYDVILDVASKTVKVVPNRSIEFALNIVKFLNQNPTSLSIDINEITPAPGYIDIDLDVTINHPLDDAGFDGYDVRGIFVGDGSTELDYNNDLVCPVPGNDQILLNADGYTRWFNPPEFWVPKIFGYIPGIYATPDYSGTATLNPYKYFGEGLGATDELWDYLNSGADDVGYFLHGTGNTRNYQLRFPVPLPGTRFGYAIVANWEGADPGDHPSHAEEAVGADVVQIPDLYYVDETDNGGDLILTISIFDWHSELTGGVMEDYYIIVESTVLSTPYTFDTSEMTPIISGDHYCTYEVSIPGDNITGWENNEGWVIVEYPDSDYKNPLGVPNDAGADPLAECFRFDVDVIPPTFIKVLAPNGGEQWAIGTDREITWDSENVPGTVFLEYSSDQFGSDINGIDTDEPNDGSYMWENIPSNPSDTVRVRISSTDDPDVFDISDGDFSIVEPCGGSGWATTWGSNAADQFHAVAIGPDENVHVAGPHDVGGFSCDIFLGKYDPTGHLIWGKEWPTNYPDFFGVDIAVDGWGNVYVTGSFAGTVDFDPDSGTYEEKSYDDLPDVFLTKFDSNGHHQWAFHWGDLGDDYGKGLGVDNLGNVYVTGFFSSDSMGLFPVDFDPDSLGKDTHYCNGEYDSFISKFDSFGDYQWARTWGGEWYEYSHELAVDGAGYAYIVGYFTGIDVDFDPDPMEEEYLTSVSSWDVFLTKFDSGGDFQWVRNWAGWYSGHLGVALDDASNVYVSGAFFDTVDFDPDPVDEDNQTSNGDTDAFLSKFEPVQGDFQWARTWGGPSSEAGFRVDSDPYGNVCVAGSFQGTDVDFDPDVGTDLHSSNGSSDAYLTRFDTNGIFQWARTWGGEESDSGYGVAISDLGCLYVSGWFKDTDVEFAPVDAPCYEDSDLHSSNGNFDGFLARYHSDGCW